MTDDEICGVECADGTPCQHPPNCPVPAHSDPDADNPQGRDFKISEEDHDVILEAARKGKSESGCARAAGVRSWAALDRYLEANPQFRSAFARARAVGEDYYIDEGARTDGEVDPSFAKFMLSSSFDYAEKSESEVTGDMDVTVTADFSDTST